MAAIRASRLPLLTKCAGSLFIPHRDDEDDTDATTWGHMAHHWKQHGEIDTFSGGSLDTKRTRTAFLKAVRLSAIDREDLWPSGGTHETSLAIRIDGTREAVLDPSREYVGREGWVTGTSDYYWHITPFGSLWVDDLKTGKEYPNPGPGVRGHNPDLAVGSNRFPQDPNSPQTRLYTLATAAVLFGPDLDGLSDIVTPTITHWPRLPVAARHRYPNRFWGRSLVKHELLAYWAKLEEMYRNPQVEPGDHCRFCPARINCAAAKEFDQ